MNKLIIPNTINVGRGEALRTSLVLADAAWRKSKQKEMTIVEIGILRDDSPQAQLGDGWSSILWAWYAQQNPKARVYLIDIDPHAIDICHNLIIKHLGNIPINVITQCTDAERWLKESELESKINLLYLDGSDDPREMIKQFRITETRNMLAKTSIVNLDDIPVNYLTQGKGCSLCPYLIGHPKWTMLLDDRKSNQMMFGSGYYANA
jgi:hypothetical protein